MDTCSGYEFAFLVCNAPDKNHHSQTYSCIIHCHGLDIVSLLTREPILLQKKHDIGLGHMKFIGLTLFHITLKQLNGRSSDNSVITSSCTVILYGPRVTSLYFSHCRNLKDGIQRMKMKVSPIIISPNDLVVEKEYFF